MTICRLAVYISETEKIIIETSSLGRKMSLFDSVQSEVSIMNSKKRKQADDYLIKLNEYHKQLSEYEKQMDRYDSEMLKWERGSDFWGSKIGDKKPVKPQKPQLEKPKEPKKPKVVKKALKRRFGSLDTPHGTISRNKIQSGGITEEYYSSSIPKEIAKGAGSLFINLLKAPFHTGDDI